LLQPTESPSIFGELPIRPPPVTSSTPFRQLAPIKQPLRLNRRDLNLTGYSKSAEAAKPETPSQPPASPKQPPSKRQKLGPSSVVDELPAAVDPLPVVVEEGPVVPDSAAVDDHEDDDLEDEDLEDAHCLSAAELLRKHRAEEFDEPDLEEDYY
jgi:hypothetical protein